MPFRNLARRRGSIVNHLSQDVARLEANDSVRSRRAWFEPLLLALLLSVWFGYELGTRALWSPDEGRYAEIPREMVASGDYLTPRLNGVKYFEKPPLVYWLTAGSIGLFGLNEWALRLWPALFALLGCLAIYFLGRRMYDARTGLFASIILAGSPLYDFMGGTLTLDMPETALLTLVLGAFLLGRRAPPGRQRRLWFYFFYVLIALAVLTKGLIGMVIPAMVIGAWIVTQGEWRLLREIHLPVGIIILLVIAAPWHILVSQANPEFTRFYFIHEHFERYLTTVHQRYQPAWYFLPVLLGGLYPWSALLPSALRQLFPGLWRERRRHRETWFLLLWAILPFAFFSVSSSKLVPYILPVFPPLALLLGRWLAQAWERRVGLVGEAVLLLLLGVVLAAVFLFLPRWMAGHVSVITAAAELGWALYAMAAALLLAGVLPFVSSRWGGTRAAILSLFVGAVVLVGTFDLTLSRLDVGRSVKGLALSLDLGPDDEVMTYEVYYQDLPVYLERRITVVNWTGELEFGARTEDTHAWIIDALAFRQRWREPHNIYLFTSQANYTKLLADPPGPLCLMRSTPHAVIIVNRECPA